MYKIGIVGLGVLGNAIKKSFEFLDINIIIKCYDKYKNIGNGVFELLDSNLIFLCLPTLYNKELEEYDKTEIYNICNELNNCNYKGIVLVKSTVESGTTLQLSKLFNNLNLVHNPEFLTARTAEIDYINQKHIVLGFLDGNDNTDTIKYLEVFFKKYFPLSKISICTTLESETMKLFCNSFYAAKIQLFTEFKLLCDNLEINFNNVRDLMISNGWINPMHTEIPGPDGNISFGGTCFPKDIKALNEVMKKNSIPNEVINAVIKEQELMRK
jgi:UDPglucose 6-dehydrogenase